MLTGTWSSPGGCDEYVLAFDKARPRRLLVIPALFDEGNKLRHFTVETMRRLDEAAVDSVLPDLPGTNESLQPLRNQTLDGWRNGVRAAAEHFRATHVLAIRAGAMLSPDHLPTINYAPASGATQLRSMLRAQVIASREIGRPESRDDLFARARREGLRLGGYDLSPAMIAALDQAAASDDGVEEISQGQIGGPALWLRTEPDHDPDQARTLADRVSRWMA